MGYSNSMTSSMLAYGADAFKNMYDIAIKFPTLSEDVGSQLVSIRAKGIKLPDFGIATYERSYHGNKIKLPKPEQEFERHLEIVFTMDAAFAYYKLFCEWLTGVGNPDNGGVSNFPTLFGEIYVNSIKGFYNPVVADNVTVKAAVPENKEKGQEAVTDDLLNYLNTGNASTSSEMAAIAGAGAKSDGVGANYSGSPADGLLKEGAQWSFKDVWVSKVTEPEFSVDSSDTLEFTVSFEFLDYNSPYYGLSAHSGTYSAT